MTTSHAKRQLPCECTHGLVVAGYVLGRLRNGQACSRGGRALGQIAAHQIVERALEQGTQAQQLVHLRVGALGLPLGNRLATHTQKHRQLLLGHVARGAQVLQVVAEAHRSVLRSCTPTPTAGASVGPECADASILGAREPPLNQLAASFLRIACQPVVSKCRSKPYSAGSGKISRSRPVISRGTVGVAMQPTERQSARSRRRSTTPAWHSSKLHARVPWRPSILG